MVYFLGIDVGTGSARAGVFDADGHMLGTSAEPIQMWRPAPDFVQQSSGDIWRAVGTATRQAIAQADVAISNIVGIGLDATCSLVLVGHHHQSISVDLQGEPQQDIMVWMDHRATDQAQKINTGAHDVLKYVGGQVSPEMQTPKLLWLKQNRPQAWASVEHFFDLPDYLTWRCTGDATRSLCTTACKWTYLGHEARALDAKGTVGWDRSYFEKIGLGDLAKENFARIGTRIRPLGEALGSGLTAQAAHDLGLLPGTAVSVSVIDAHAGGIGLLGAGEGTDFNRRLALIGGTSSCHMAVAPDARFVPGVWGPYFSAMVPGLWLNEGGQSATGSLIDRIVFGHAASAQVQSQADREGTTPYAILNDRLKTLAKNRPIDMLTQNLHVDPDFHGNRSPYADPTLRGTVAGLRLEQGPDELARLYLATIQAVAYGTRLILETLNHAGYCIDTLIACGGGTKNPVFLQQHANATKCCIQQPREAEAVLLGSAILGAVAAGTYTTVPQAMAKMSRIAQSVPPCPDVADYHDRKYHVFQRLHEDQRAYRKLMTPTL